LIKSLNGLRFAAPGHFFLLKTHCEAAFLDNRGKQLQAKERKQMIINKEYQNRAKWMLLKKLTQFHQAPEVFEAVHTLFVFLLPAKG
jgi:hypothetical protein